MHEGGTGAKRLKKNRNQSSKRKIIEVLDPNECGVKCECPKPVMVDSGTDAPSDKRTIKATCSVEAQTTTTLPDTIREVMWTPSGIDPVVEVEESDGSLEPGILEDDTVDDIDNLEAEDNTPESPGVV